MITAWLQQYQPKSREEVHQALREILQEIALAGLYRSGFFERAAFYGGTALRIFYGLNRFSEDLDFSLLEKKNSFTLEPYLDALVKEFAALGITVAVKGKVKSKQTSVDSAFLKSETLWKEIIVEGSLLQLPPNEKVTIKIKLEVDTDPPLGFVTEEKLLLKPFSFYVKSFTLPDLFAGKLHALLFRKWKNRVKGRDWFDLEWYIKRGTAMHLSHFALRAKQGGDWQQETISREAVLLLLEEKIKTVSMEQIKADIERFIPNPSVLNVWSIRYFTDLVHQLKVTDE